MRKKVWLLILFFTFALSLLWFFKGESSDDFKVWIFFKDHSHTRLNASAIQQVHFSAEAIERRQVRGLQSWSETDLPIDRTYVNQVKSAGAKVFVESRWLNAVSAKCNADCRDKITKLSFVADIRPVATFVQSRVVEKKVEAISSEIHASKQTSSEINYGPSRQQLEQINAIEAHRKGYTGQGETIAIFGDGFRRDHLAFKGHDVVDERNFVTHEQGKGSCGTNTTMGTSTWSILGGEASGQLYGPSFKSKVILAATDVLGSDTRTDEDNWVAAFEWADQLGATVICSNLGFSSLYQSTDLNGRTAVSSRIASTAAMKGIVVATNAGVSGAISPPADAFDILAVGTLDANLHLLPFSSKGPTVDGRLKPEVVARGIKLYKASVDDQNAFTFGEFGASGLHSASLVAGGAAVVLSARPDWNPLQVREALMKTANRADHPDNSYGYGLINVVNAIDFLPANSVVIDHTPVKKVKNTGLPIKIFARIRAQRRLNQNQLSLFWKKEGGMSFQKIKMLPVVGAADNFQAFIPPQSKGITVLYYLTAKDIKGKSTKAPFGAANVFKFTIL